MEKQVMLSDMTGVKYEVAYGAWGDEIAVFDTFAEATSFAHILLKSVPLSGPDLENGFKKASIVAKFDSPEE